MSVTLWPKCFQTKRQLCFLLGRTSLWNSLLSEFQREPSIWGETYQVIFSDLSWVRTRFSSLLKLIEMVTALDAEKPIFKFSEQWRRWLSSWSRWRRWLSSWSTWGRWRGTLGQHWLLKQFSLNHPVEHTQKPKLAKLYVRVETSTSYFIIHSQFVK